jgi:hypothetical protein
MTVDTTCPNCGTLYTLRSELIGKRTKCTRCGAHFTITESPHVPTPPPVAPIASPAPPPQPVYTDIPTHLPHVAHTRPRYEEPSAAHSTHGRAANFLGFEKNDSSPAYPAVKMVARAYEILAIVVLVCAAGWLIVEIIRAIQMPQQALLHLLNGIIAILWGLATALMCLFVSQMTRLALQIEHNTRETSTACRQLAEHFSAIEHEP